MKATLGIRVLVFLAILIAGFLYLEKVFASKNDFVTTSQQFDKVVKETNIDVILMGSSHMYASINPLLLDKNNKTISFNIGTATMNFDFTTLLLEKVLKKTKPKLVIIELSRGSLPQLSEREKGFHLRLLDYSSDFSRAKFQKVNQYFEPKEYLGVYSQVYRNHEDWATVDYIDIESEKTINAVRRYKFKGYTGARDSIGPELRKKFKDQLSFTPKSDSTKAIFNQMHIDQFKHLKALSEKHNFEVLFITTPDLQSWRYNGYLYTRISEVSESFGFKYLNMSNTQDKIRFSLGEFIDEYHLNLWGGVKATNYLSEYIDQNYSLPDRSSTPYWQNQREAFQDFDEGFVTGGSEQEVMPGQNLYLDIKLNRLGVKKYADKLLFTADFDSILTDTLNAKYRFVIQVFPKKGFEDQLSARTKEIGRSFDTRSVVIEDYNKTQVISFPTRIEAIERLRFLIIDNGPYTGTKGKAIEVKGEALKLDL
ncbi:MAG: hypothetical protein ABJM06_10805 [Gilvibacter sp.]